MYKTEIIFDYSQDGAEYPEFRTILDNGVTLCSKCHNEFHSKYGKGKNTKSQFEEYKFYKQLLNAINSITKDEK